VTQAPKTRVTENYVTPVDTEAQSLVLTDFSDRSTWMMEFSVTLVFWSCVTLGFFNSEKKNWFMSVLGSGIIQRQLWLQVLS
jgi:hypothetical protein